MSKANARFPLAALTAALLCVALAACGGGGGGHDSTGTQSPTNNTNVSQAASSVFATGLNKPVGIARAEDGSFYVADAGTFTVRKIDAAGGAATLYAGTEGVQGNGAPADVEPRTAATFSDLRSIAAAGNAVYVVDGTSVRLINDGSVVVVIPGLQNPKGLAVDAGFNVFVADAGDGTAGSGTITRGWFDTESHTAVIATGLNNPTSLAVDSEGNLFVTEVGANGATTVKKIAGAANLTTAAPAADVSGGSGFTNATGIVAGSASSNLYVIEPQRVTTLTNTGAKTTKSVAAKQLSGVTTALTGNDLYVTDATGNNVLKVTP
ncbi:hypothetical protein [Noviherbaspirillum massiliense]|uniref:hypothetical protein n=1 Tax=Noviherbaspirillum massiliense TaxID=1465823 RepID=UPI0002DAE4A8|nr:hypothetical protein [Noviherbaspirillum massiliense]